MKKKETKENQSEELNSDRLERLIAKINSENDALKKLLKAIEKLKTHKK